MQGHCSTPEFVPYILLHVPREASSLLHSTVRGSQKDPAGAPRRRERGRVASICAFLHAGNFQQTGGSFLASGTSAGRDGGGLRRDAAAVTGSCFCSQSFRDVDFRFSVT